MPAAPLALLFAALASAATARAQTSDEPTLAARSDGSWQVLEAIHEEPPPIASVTGGLLTDEQEWADAREAADAIAEVEAEAEAEAAAERAFEEAIDAARREPRR